MKPRGVMATEGVSLLTLIILNVAAVVVLRLCLLTF